MKTEKTEMIMKYFDVTYKVAKQYEIILKDKQLRQIKAWYETKKGLNYHRGEWRSAEGNIEQRQETEKVFRQKSWWQPDQ